MGTAITNRQGRQPLLRRADVIAQAAPVVGVDQRPAWGAGVEAVTGVEQQSAVIAVCRAGVS